MNNRQKEIIKVLSQTKEWCSGKYLADYFGVTSRTIRSDIEAINHIMDAKMIVSNQHYGYKIEANANVEVKSEHTQHIPQTSDERYIYILKKLLFDSREISIRKLQEELFVSESTIEKEITRIRKMVKIYPDLEIKRTKNYIVIVGSEINKRKLYKNLLSIETNGNFINLDRMNALFTGFDLIKVKNVLTTICNNYNFEIKEATFPVLMVHIGISIDRMQKRNYIHFEEGGFNETLKEYQIASDFYHEIQKYIKIEIVEAEIQLLASLLNGRTNVSATLYDREIDIERLMNDIIEEIYNVYSIDMRHDDELKTGLKAHISLMISRINNFTEIDNIFLVDLKKNYPLIFDISVHVADYIQSKIGCRISENEIGFLALHIGAAYERVDMNSVYHAVLIIPHNQSFAQLCSSKISAKFSHRMRICSVVNYFEEKNIIDLCPDMILTTTPFEHNLSIPVVPISVFVNLNDERNISNTLNNLDKTRLSFAFMSKIIKITSSKFFYKDLDLKTPKSIIELIGKDLYEANIVEENFTSKVLQREELSPASFACSIATPHAFGVDIKQSTIAIAFLKEAIMWGDYKVKIVILLAVQEQDAEILRLFFEWLSYVINSPELFNRLLSVNTYDEFILEMII